MRRDSGQTKRFLLAYFIEGKIWKTYLEAVVNNYAYWTGEEPKRAARMLAARADNKLGYTIYERICDMLDCIATSNLANRTKQRLYDDLDETEKWHMNMGTLEDEL